MGANGPVRKRLRVVGVVQGVGFRPFVYREAESLRLSGWVANDAAGVIAEVEGDEAAVEHLCRAILDDPPSLARVDRLVCTPLIPTGSRGFRIAASRIDERHAVSIGPDVATCDACLREIADPDDRRHRYPFTNCTACGPRYTIVTASPYDRPATTMKDFRLCGPCRHEYETPSDRRFHAEPTACPACGPRLELLLPSGVVAADHEEAVAVAVAEVIQGRVLAIKGLGGFHLACDAVDATAVGRVRDGKRRPRKPFAVMVASLARAGDLIVLDAVTERLLTSPQRPIVLAPRRADAPIADAVAPGTDEIGVMLPYTPLHHLLLAALARPIVMTSGNRSGEPIVHDDRDAVARLGPAVDALLVHDRPIHIPCDDSVVRSVGGRAQVLRRSRGEVPTSIALPFRTPRPVLAVGADLKNTVSIAFGDEIVASHHLGDLGDLDAYRGFQRAIDHLCHLSRAVPEVVVHDLHPDFRSTAHAIDMGLPSIAVQHHHAHVASCLVDHAETGPVIGIAFDGFGFGADGTAWGGEFLLADLEASERLGHIRTVPLPGGATAIREPWRMALSWVQETLGTEAAERCGPLLDHRWAGVLAVAARRDCIRTSAAGRLFDAVAALLGVCSIATYEGQAAVELETLASRASPGDLARMSTSAGPPVQRRSSADGVLVLDPAAAIATIVDGRARGVAPAILAAWFHDALADATAAAANDLAARHHVDTVVLTGGVFQNRRLAIGVRAASEARGLRVLVHERVPPNDGGISIGQAAIACARLHACRDIPAPPGAAPIGPSTVARVEVDL